MVEVENLGLPWANVGDFVVAALGSTSLSGQRPVTSYLPFKVRKTVRFQFAYTWTEYNTNFQPLAPVGLSGVPGLAQSFFVNNLQMGVNTVPGVTNLWTITQNFEGIQAFIGVAPSPLRVYLQQPPTSGPVGSMDQNLVPTSNFYDEGWYDGYSSPYSHPSEQSQILVLAGQEPWFTMANPTSVIVEPEFMLYMNRMFLAPITEQTLAQEVVTGKLENTHIISVGNPLTNATYNSANYPGAIVVEMSGSGSITVPSPPGGGPPTNTGSISGGT